MLPVESQRALEEFGAVQYELTDLPQFPGERFNVVAARSGDDVWVEIRRRYLPAAERPQEEIVDAAQEAVPGLATRVESDPGGGLSPHTEPDPSNGLADEATPLHRAEYVRPTGAVQQGPSEA